MNRSPDFEVLDAPTCEPSQYISEALMLAYGFVLFPVAMRVLAGTGVLSNMGFTPVGPSLLFFGSRIPRKQLWVPVALLIGSAVYLTFGPDHQSGMPRGELLIWACDGGVFLCGILPQG